MQTTRTVLNPEMPEFIYFESAPGQRQDGFANAGANRMEIKDLTAGQAADYAELMKQTFIKHWSKETGRELPVKEKDLTDGEFVLGVGLIKEPIGPYTRNLLGMKKNLAAVLDGLRAFSTEPAVDDQRRKKIYEADEAVMEANNRIEAAYQGLD